MVFLVILGFFEYTHTPYIYNSNSTRRDFETLLFSPPLVYGWCCTVYNFCLLNEWYTCSCFVQKLKLNLIISEFFLKVNVVTLFICCPIMCLEAFSCPPQWSSLCEATISLLWHIQGKTLRNQNDIRFAGLMCCKDYTLWYCSGDDVTIATYSLTDLYLLKMKNAPFFAPLSNRLSCACAK